ncbi:MAG: YtxH domain-containing protein [Bacteroidota bacterium]
MSIRNVLIGVMAGVAAGATLGILYAPEKGSATRKRFSRRSYDYTDELESKFNDLIDNITEQFQSMVEEVNLISENDRLKQAKTK